MILNNMSMNLYKKLVNELGNYVSDFKAKAMKESNAADEAGEKGFFCYDEIEGD